MDTILQQIIIQDIFVPQAPIVQVVLALLHRAQLVPIAQLVQQVAQLVQLVHIVVVVAHLALHAWRVPIVLQRAHHLVRHVRVVDILAQRVKQAV